MPALATKPTAPGDRRRGAGGPAVYPRRRRFCSHHEPRTDCASGAEAGTGPPVGHLFGPAPDHPIPAGQRPPLRRRAQSQARSKSGERGTPAENRGYSPTLVRYRTKACTRSRQLPVPPPAVTHVIPERGVGVSGRPRDGGASPLAAHDGVDAATGVGGTFGSTSRAFVAISVGQVPRQRGFLLVPQQNNVVRGVDYEVLGVMDIAAR